MNCAYRLLAILTCAVLAACGSNADLKESLGLNRQGPDEFRVLSRPPLSVPPEFNLRPPGQGTEYVSGIPAQSMAHNEVLGATTASSTIPPSGSPVNNVASTAVTGVSTGELMDSSDAQLLANAGSNKADPQIRQKLLDDKLNGPISKDPNYLLGGKTVSDSQQVDPAKEAERLKQDKAQNKPPTAGDTPVIDQPDKGFLGTIF